MTPEQVVERAGALQLLDVREAFELREARVEWALHIPMHDLPARLSELDRGRPIAVLCRSGNRSAHVTDYLTSLGFEAHNVEGGIVRWARAGLPMTG